MATPPKNAKPNKEQSRCFLPRGDPGGGAGAAGAGGSWVPWEATTGAPTCPGPHSGCRPLWEWGCRQLPCSGTTGAHLPLSRGSTAPRRRRKHAYGCSCLCMGPAPCCTPGPSRTPAPSRTPTPGPFSRQVQARGHGPTGAVMLLTAARGPQAQARGAGGGGWPMHGRHVLPCFAVDVFSTFIFNLSG